MTINPTPPPPTQPQQQGTDGMPWWMRFFANPAMIANVVAFGAALLLLYTAAIEWPRRVDRFHEQMSDQRDATRELAALGRENQRLMMRIETLEVQQATQIQVIRDTVAEIRLKQKEDEKPPP